MLKRFLIVTAALCLIATGLHADNPNFGPGHYTVTFNSVTYDVAANTSTWSYTVVWNGNPPALSHFGVEFCSQAQVLSFSPTEGGIVGPDPSLGNPNTDCQYHGFYGIKWDTPNGIPANTPMVYTFTLDGLYADEQVHYSAKAAEFCNLGTITGPSKSCAKMPLVRLQKSCLTPDAFAGGTLQYTIAVNNPGEVALSNINVSDPGATISGDACASSLNPGESTQCTYTSIAPLGSGCSVIPVTNTATVSASDADGHNALIEYAPNSCSSTAWRLCIPGGGAGATANTSFTRSWTWQIAKAAGDAVTIPQGQSGSVPFVIHVSSSHSDHDYTVGGSFGVFNPSPLTASIASATVNLSSTGDTVSANCPSTIGPNSSVTCTFSKDLGSNNSDGTATLTVMLAGGGPFSGSVDYSFAGATENDDASKCVTITDLPGPIAGFTVPPAFAVGQACGDTDQNIPVAVSVTNNSVGCEQFTSETNTATLSGGATGSSSATGAIYSGQCPSGCTLTIGFWKNHAGFGPQPDEVTPLLPQLLGTSGGAKTVNVATTGQAVNLLSFSGQASNGINKLYGQLLGAKFSIARGASPSAVSSVISSSDNFLATHDSSDWSGLTKQVQQQVNQWMSTLDSYNNGLIGPSHCN